MAMADNAYNVQASMIDGEELMVNLTVRTKVMHSSMCPLTTTHYEVSKLPQGREEIMHIGEIRLEFKENPLAMCMMAAGPHSGNATFTVGEYGAPALMGLYNLYINGDHYGILSVTNDSVSIDDAVAL